MNAERRDHLNRAQATRHVAEKILQPDEVVSYCAPAARVLSLSTITQWFRQCLCRKSEGAVSNALGADWFLVLCSLRRDAHRQDAAPGWFLQTMIRWNRERPRGAERYRLARVCPSQPPIPPGTSSRRQTSTRMVSERPRSCASPRRPGALPPRVS